MDLQRSLALWYSKYFSSIMNLLFQMQPDGTSSRYGKTRVIDGSAITDYDSSFIVQGTHLNLTPFYNGKWTHPAMCCIG